MGPPAPLLAGRLAGETRRVLDRITTDLIRLAGSEPSRPRPVPLLADHALYLSHIAVGLNRDDCLPAVDRLLDEVAERFAELSDRPGLYDGYSGVALTLIQVERLLADDGLGASEEEAYEAVDEGLHESLGSPAEDLQYDLISGLCGYGTYFLSRRGGASAREGLRLTVKQLSALAESAEDGITWLSRPAHLPPWQREETPNGHYNVGVAHGVPGLAVMLASAVACGLGGPEAERLLEGGVTWTLAQRQEASAVGALFPAWTYPGREPSFSRLAWCYGDAGVGAALLNASQLVGREDWAAEALEILVHCAGRRGAAAGVQDAGLCHGAAGLGHIFHLAFRHTGDSLFSQAALHWFEQALAMPHDDFDGGGFWAYEAMAPNADGQWVPAEDPVKPDSSFLTGSAGVGLALLTALTGMSSAWDHRLLLSQGLAGGQSETAEEGKERHG